MSNTMENKLIPDDLIVHLTIMPTWEKPPQDAEEYVSRENIKKQWQNRGYEISDEIYKDLKKKAVYVKSIPDTNSEMVPRTF